MNTAAILLCAQLACAGHNYALDCSHARLYIDSKPAAYIPCCPTGELTVLEDGTALVNWEEFFTTYTTVVHLNGEVESYLPRIDSTPGCFIPTPTPTPVMEDNSGMGGCQIGMSSPPPTSTRRATATHNTHAIVVPTVQPPQPTNTPRSVFSRSTIWRYNNGPWVFLPTPRNQHWHYRLPSFTPQAVIAADNEDPIIEDPTGEAAEIGNITQTRPGLLRLQLALDIPSTWTPWFANRFDLLDFVRAFWQRVDGITKRDLGVTIEITMIQIWDNFTQPYIVVDDMMKYWQRNWHSCTDTDIQTNLCYSYDDVMEMNVGENPGGSSGGGGFGVATPCKGTHSFGWCSTWPPSDSVDGVNLCAHELGHSLGGNHTDWGGFIPPVDRCWSTGMPPPFDGCPDFINIPGWGGLLSYCKFYGCTYPPELVRYDSTNAAIMRHFVEFARSLDPDNPVLCLDTVDSDCRFDNDSDGDTIPDSCDNCAAIANMEQGDMNDNGVGDACEAGACTLQRGSHATRIWLLLLPLAILLGKRQLSIYKRR